MGQFEVGTSMDYMDTENKHIEVLIARFLAGDAAREELDELTAWIDRNQENLAYFLKMKNIWDTTHPAFDPRSIHAGEALNDLWIRIGKARRKRMGRMLVGIWPRIAAVIALPLLAATVWMGVQHIRRNNHEVAYQEVTVLYGTRSTVTLSDGSTVWLNGGSRLKYPVSFGRNVRTVEMDGEAYFKVTADKESPFIVRTARADVTAVGTKFNVEAYSGDSLLAVTLAEGGVEVALPGTSEMLKPRERLVYDASTGRHSIYLGDTYKWCAWKDGVLAFRNDPLNYVFKRLGQTYNIDFIVDKSIEDHIYYATFEGESLDKILSLLEKSAPIRFRRLSEETEKNDFSHRQRIEVKIRE